MNKRASFSALALSALLLYGCGPGFPIMTREQEDLVMNTEKLLKEQDALKARVDRMEGSGGVDSIKRDMESVKRSVAEANIGLERLSQELSEVKGGLEEGGTDRESVKNAAVEANEAAASLKEEVVSGQRRLALIETSDQGRDQTIAEIKDAVARLESRLTTLEKAVLTAKTEQAEAKEYPEAVYQRGYTLVASKDYPNAITTFQKFLANYPEHRLASNAQYWLGEIYYAKGDWEMAILEFDKVIKKYPDAEKAPASLLKQGFSFEKLGSVNEAAVLLQDVMDKYPKSPEAAMAKKRLAAIKKK